MRHGLREAMAPLEGKIGPSDGKGKTAEGDTTYIGGKEKNKHPGKRSVRSIGGAGEQIVHTRVERGGRARSNQISNVSGAPPSSDVTS